MSWTHALREGLEKEGVKTFVRSAVRPAQSDIAVVWGARNKKIFEAAQSSNSQRVLVMERGFIQPRRQWISLAIDGLNARGVLPNCQDNGERWNKYFAHHVKPWKKEDNGRYALIIGQTPNDAALWGIEMSQWAQEQTNRLLALDLKVVYRPHPQIPTPCPEGASLSAHDLASDLSNAHRVVTYNSTTAVESILAGVPTVIYDPGSVAYGMASHDIDAPLVRPDRTHWMHTLAWRQWRVEELTDGYAWRILKQLL